MIDAERAGRGCEHGGQAGADAVGLDRRFLHQSSFTRAPAPSRRARMTAWMRWKKPTPKTGAAIVKRTGVPILPE